MKVFVQKVHHHFLPSLLLVIFENIPLKLGKGYTVGLAKFLGRLKEILALRNDAKTCLTSPILLK